MRFPLLVRLVALAGACAAQDQQPAAVVPGSAGRAPSDAVVLFDGSDLSHWATSKGEPAKCEVLDGAMACTTGSGDLYSRETFRDAQIHIEFNIPLMAGQKGQLRGNSGVYLQGRYELQILDSHNNPTYSNGALGALYGQYAPLVNPARPPGEWQSYDIVFHAPRCDADGRVTRPGTVTALVNGVLALDHVEILRVPRDCARDEGPLRLQDHSGFPGAPVTVMKFRNIWFRRLR
jgi:hypothetical protein